MDIKELFEQITALLEKNDYQSLRTIFLENEPFDLALICEELDEKTRPFFFRLMPRGIAAECFSHLSVDVQESLLKHLTDTELRAMLDELFIDDTVDLIEELPANVAARILENSDAESREQINQILHYPKDSAGSIMTVEYVRLGRNMSIADAFARIRRVGMEKETIYTCYVTDSDRTLVGVVTAMDLLLNETDTLVSEIMETNVISVTTHEHRDSVVQKFSHYDFLAIPVVDDENRLMGIVTVDDAIDVAVESATEDVEIMAGITPTDKPYLKVGVFETWWSRIPWLMLLMLSATFTGAIISSFESALSKVAVLTSFIPMLMGTAGNAGGQTSVTIIRALSLGDVEPSDVLKILWKELRVSFLCGVSLAAVGFVKALFVDGAGSAWVALAVSVTLAATVIAAKTVGCCFPLLIKKLGFDPAVVANPFITTVVDALALLVYFAVATSLIPALQ